MQGEIPGKNTGGQGEPTQDSEYRFVTDTPRHGSFDQDISRKIRSPEQFEIHAFALMKFMAFNESLAELPAGSDVAPNAHRDWYVEHGALLVVDTETICTGDLLTQEQIEAYEPLAGLLEEPAAKMLDRRLAAEEDTAKRRNGSIDLSMVALRYCGIGGRGQQIVRIRSVSAGVLVEHNGTFHLLQYGIKWKNGKISGVTFNKPANEDLYLPATVGEIQPIELQTPSLTVVAQKLRGVTVVDTYVRPQGRRSRPITASPRLGRLATQPSFQV